MVDYDEPQLLDDTCGSSAWHTLQAQKPSSAPPSLHLLDPVPPSPSLGIEEHCRIAEIRVIYAYDMRAHTLKTYIYIIAYTYIYTHIFMWD